MADVRQEIMADMKAAFDLITVAGGYNFNVGHTGTEYKHFAEIPEDKFPAVMVVGARERRENSTNKTFKSEMELVVVGFVKSADAQDSAGLSSRLNQFIADVTKALHVDHTRGGKSTFTEITDVDDDKGRIQPYAMFEMLVSVEYRAAWTQP